MAVGVVFLQSFYEAIMDLEDKERLGAYDAIIRYGLYGEVVEMNSSIRALFTLIRPVIDSSQNRYKASVENGRKGGRPPKNQNEIQHYNQNVKQENDIENASDTKKEQDNADKREKESLRGEGGTNLLYHRQEEVDLDKRRDVFIAQLEQRKENKGKDYTGSQGISMDRESLNAYKVSTK